MIKLLRYPVITVLLLGIQVCPCNAGPLAVTPFYTFNQSPLVQIYGLPSAESAIIQAPGHAWSLLAMDAANNFTYDNSNHDHVNMDGESYRLTIALRYGVSDKLEVGADLPWVGYSGGVFDGFIEGWHSFFGLPQGGRTQVPANSLLFNYYQNDQEKLLLDKPSFGIGDIRLSGGWQLYNDGTPNPCAVALRTSLKLPTGNSTELHGSGSTDLAVWLTGSNDYPLNRGHMTLFGAAGGMALTKGQVLPDQQNHVVGLGSLGIGWSPADWIAWKTQLSVHTPFYKDSDLPEIGKPAIQLLIGGTLAFSSKTALDIAVSEDAYVATSPDVALHLGLSHQF